MTLRQYIEYARGAVTEVNVTSKDTFPLRLRLWTHFDLSTLGSRLYGKDAPCPPQWAEWLGKNIVPKRTLPLNRDDLFSFLEPEVGRLYTV